MNSFDGTLYKVRFIHYTQFCLHAEYISCVLCAAYSAKGIKKPEAKWIASGLVNEEIC